MSKKTMTTEELQAEVRRLHVELRDREEAALKEQGQPLVGKCYRYRNCYSCPQTEKDYWWLYKRVVSVEGSSLHTFSFETDRNGDIRIQHDEFGHTMQFLNNMYEEIPAKTFNREWRKVQKRVAEMK